MESSQSRLDPFVRRGDDEGVSPSVMAFWVVLLFAVPFALWKGGTPERLAAAVLAAMTVIGVTAHRFIPIRYDHVDAAALTVDLLGFIGMTAIALYADRSWPLWTAALQLLSSMSHLIRFTSGTVEQLVYSWVKSLPTFLVLLILIGGTILHRRRLRRFGTDPSWRLSLPPPSWTRSIERYWRN